MIDNIDEARELSSADKDPQFQDPDAYDEDAWLDMLLEADNHIDDAIRVLQAANEEHEVKGGDRIVKLLIEASCRLEEAR